MMKASETLEMPGWRLKRPTAKSSPSDSSDPLVSSKVQVVSGMIRRRRGVFIAQRSCGKWEFPGGKIECRESHLDALSRELREELGIEVLGTPRYLCTHEGNKFVVHVYEVTEWNGEPAGLEGQPVQWTTPRVVASLDCTPSAFTALNTL